MKAAVRGFLVGVLFLVLAAAWILIGVARGYDGTCGGLFPFLAGPRECPFMEYFIGMGGTSLLIAVVQGWPVALAVLLVPTGAGYWLGRRSAHSV